MRSRKKQVSLEVENVATRAVEVSPKRLKVAVCIETRDGPGRERLLGIYRYAQTNGWQLLPLRSDDRRALRDVLMQGLDGAILYDKPASVHRRFRSAGLPCVETGNRNLSLDDAAVFVDDDAVAAQAFEHLSAVGFEHFAFCGRIDDRVSAIRAERFADQVRTAGGAARLFADQWPDGAADLSNLTSWLKDMPKPAGILVFDDKLAERVLTACRGAGIRVPEDVGVLGIGDDELICELSFPVLSSVALPTREIGRRAAELLESLVLGKTILQRRCAVPPIGVVPRASTERYAPKDAMVAAAVDFIRAHYRRPIGTDQVAEAIQVPRRTLERRFAAEMKATLHDFVVELRMNRAKRLLRQSLVPISEIAHACGYLGISSFARMFEAKTGETVEGYRAKFHGTHIPHVRQVGR